MVLSTRRHFIKQGVVTTGGLALATALPGCTGGANGPLFEISLAQWSLYRSLFAGDIDHLDFPGIARNDFDIGAVEYVNTFFFEKAEDESYLAQMQQRCDDNGVSSQLIMCDREGAIGDPDDTARTQAVENHYKWVTAAAYLGCHSIRVNAQSEGSWEEQRGLAADGLARLSEFAADHGLNVIVENHGGLSSNGQWLAEVIGRVGMDNCGTLPDFGNFRISEDENYDRYKGVEELMPFAKGVSAKSYGFDAQGNETTIDYRRMLQIVLDAGYHGHVGIEWEGQNGPSEMEGIRLTKNLLETIREEMAA